MPRRWPADVPLVVVDLDGIGDEARAFLDSKFAAREIAIAGSRRSIRASANAIRATHRGDAEEAAELLAAAGTELTAAREAVTGHPDLEAAGFMRDAAKEFSEANLTVALTAGRELPPPADLEVPVAAYLNGLGEAVGELRRRLLDQLRAGGLAEGEATFADMEAILDLLATMDYPDGMTGGLRRTTDVARALVERSRADLTTTITQERLRRDLQGS